jgi:hypothetical protein
LIWESYYWKRELTVLAGDIAAWGALYATANEDWDEEAGFRLERSLFYSSFIVRKLIECQKITDLLRDQKIELLTYASKIPGPQKLMHMYGSLKLEEYDFESPQKVPFDAWDLSSEILHSLTLMFQISEDRGGVAGFFVSSKRNNWKRLIDVPISSWLSIMTQFAEDDVTESKSSFEDGKFQVTLK